MDTQQKSRKRKAAELKLAKRASSANFNQTHDDRSHLAGIHDDHIESLDATGSTSSSSSTGCSVQGEWTGMPVQVPAQVDWGVIFSDSQYFCKHKMNKILDIMVVEEDVVNGLRWLKEGMSDCVVAIDLEWRPDSRHTNNKVACIQLATQTRCLIIRCCRWKGPLRILPQVLVDFFNNPKLVFVSFSWDTGDEKKMRWTFGNGKEFFTNFIDIQNIAMKLGYPDKCGLSMLSRYVLGTLLPKSKCVSRSDWQRHELSAGQIRYAALDAFVTGEIFRMFRFWNEAPSLCLSCNTERGSILYTCGDMTEVR